MEEPIFSHQTDPTGPDNSVDDPTSSSSYLTSIFRLSTVLFIAAISLWANYEASKGFGITVLEAPGNTLAARHYNLMFVSNGAAARAILNVSASIDRTLFPDADYFPRKPIRSVTLRVAGYNLSRAVIVTAAAGGGGGDYVIHVSPNVIEEGEADKAVVAAVYRGMARVSVWDGQGMAPAAVVEAVVGYMCGAAGFGGEIGGASVTAEGCEVGTAGFVAYCEKRRPGFVARLNKAMEERWEDGMLDEALGTSTQAMCAGFRAGLGWVEGEVGNSTGKMLELLQLG